MRHRRWHRSRLIFLLLFSVCLNPKRSFADYSTKLRILCRRLLQLGKPKSGGQPKVVSLVRAGDILPSELGKAKHKNVDAYQTWAAAEINHQIPRLGHEAAELVFESFRKSYRGFAIEKGASHASKIDYRFGERGHYGRSTIGIHVKKGKPLNSEEESHAKHYPIILASAAESFGGFPRKAHYMDTNWDYAEVLFHDSNGEKILEGSLMHHTESTDANIIIYRSPQPTEAKAAFRNIMQRIDALAPKAWTQTTKREWANLLRGYFLVMPLERGSAGVGRAFFSAVAAKMRNRPLRIPGDIDLFAVSRNEERFYTWCVDNIADF